MEENNSEHKNQEGILKAMLLKRQELILQKSQSNKYIFNYCH